MDKDGLDIVILFGCIFVVSWIVFSILFRIIMQITLEELKAMEKSRKITKKSENPEKVTENTKK